MFPQHAYVIRKPKPMALPKKKQAGVAYTPEQVQVTLKVFRYVAGLRIFNFMPRCRGDVHPYILEAPGMVNRPGTPSREEIRNTLWAMMDRAINRRANITWPKKGQSDYEGSLFRDKRALDDLLTLRVRVYQWETKLFKDRFSHLLASREDLTVLDTWDASRICPLQPPCRWRQ